MQWREVQDVQNIFRRAAIWNGFPAEGLKFISAEIQPGDENQRIDVLYLRDDGGLYVCELKVGGEFLDSHGQIIRYIADLCYQTINTQWVINKHLVYLRNSGVTSEQELRIAETELRTHLDLCQLCDRHIRLIKNAGIIIDEDFKPQMLKAVRYLNEYCGFSIRLLRIQAFVSQDWQPTTTPFLMRLQISEIQ